MAFQARAVINNTANGAAAGSAGGGWGAAIGGALGLASSFFGNSGKNSARAAAEQYQYNLALQRDAQRFNEYMYRNRYQMQREDLEKAGINALYGLGTAPSVTSGTNSIGMPDYVGEKNNKVQNFLTGIDLASNLTARRVQNDKIKQETLTEYQNTELKKLERINSSLEALYRKKELDNYDKKLKAELQNMYSQTVKNIAEAGEAGARTKNINENTKGQGNMNIITGREAKWIEDHPIMSGLGIGIKYLGPGAKVIKDIAETGAGNTKVGKAIKKANRGGTARNVRRSN